MSVEINQRILGRQSEKEKNALKKSIQELNQRVEQLEKEREEIIELINKFSGLNQKILKLKYVEGLTLESIADETGYSYQYIKNKHAEIMRIIEFQEKFEEE